MITEQRLIQHTAKVKFFNRTGSGNLQNAVFGTGEGFGKIPQPKNSFKRKKDALLLPKRQKECVLFCLYNSVSVKNSG